MLRNHPVELPPLRSRDELYFAHDALRYYLEDLKREASVATETNYYAASYRAAETAINVLCWVLHHDHNAAFANQLHQIVANLREKGIDLVCRQEMPEPAPPGPVNEPPL